MKVGAYLTPLEIEPIESGKPSGPSCRLYPLFLESVRGTRRCDDSFGGAYLTPLEVEPARFSLNPV